MKIEDLKLLMDSMQGQQEILNYINHLKETIEYGKRELQQSNDMIEILQDSLSKSRGINYDSQTTRLV